MSHEEEKPSAGVPELVERSPSLLSPSGDVYEHDIKVPGQRDPAYGSDFVKEEGVKQGLYSRHLQLMSLAGSLGTGLFLSTGYALGNAGPVGMLLAYIFMSTIVISVVFSMTELSALAPTSGSYVRHTGMFIHPSVGFAVGWNLVFGSAFSAPSTLTSIAVLCQYWKPDLNVAIPITIFGIATLAANVFKVRVYGEIEYWFAILKILFVVGLIIFGFCIDLGAGPNHDRIGFRYWKDPGPFNSYLVEGSTGKFVGFWYVMTGAAYSFSGLESTAIAAAEVKHPRTAVPQAAKRVFFRVGGIYLASLFVISLIVPSNDDDLFAGYGTAATSPFVVAAGRAGVSGVASLINALILLSAWSSNNTSLFGGSRSLLGLALDGKAPKLFAKTHGWGVPYYGIAFVAAFMPLAYTAVSSDATTVFYYFVSIVSASVITDWFLICVAAIRLHAGLQAQGIPTTRLPFVSWFQPYLSWYGAITSFLVLLTAGFTLFIGQGLPNMTAQGFLTSYAAPLLSFFAFVAHTTVKKTTWPALHDLPIEPWLQHWADHPEPPKEKKTTVQWLKAIFIS